MTQVTPGSSAREPFAVQAAKFSLYTPIVLIVLNMAVQGGAKGSQTVSNDGLARLGIIILSSISLVLVIAGFVLGLVALAGMKRHGTKNILGRAVTGVVLNGLFLLAWVFALVFLSGLAGRMKAPVDHSLTTAVYVSKGVPSPADPWTAADYQKAVAALQPLADGDMNSLPRWKSPASGEMFARISAKENLTVLGTEAASVQERLAPESKIAIGLQPLMQVYLSAGRRGARYPEEMVELTRFGLELCVQMDRDMGAFLALIPKDRPEYQKVAEQFEKGKEGLSMAVESWIDVLGDKKNVRTESLTRLAGYERELLPPLMHAVTPTKASELMLKVRQYRDRETDATFKAALDDLLSAMTAAAAK